MVIFFFYAYVCCVGPYRLATSLLHSTLHASPTSLLACFIRIESCGCQYNDTKGYLWIFLGKFFTRSLSF